MTRQNLIDWLRERQGNCIRIAKNKTRQDRQGWLEDAAYFQAAIVEIESLVSCPPNGQAYSQADGSREE